MLIALDLAPADTATLDAERVQTIITEEGGPTSHTAILAKSLGIPAVVTVHGATGIAEARPSWSTGPRGRWPSPPTRPCRAGRARGRAGQAGRPGGGQRARPAPSDRHPVQLLVNIAGDKDLAPAAAADSEGVGLFRTEFLFLDRPNAPTLEEQQAVCVRLRRLRGPQGGRADALDAGADKPLEFVTVPDEPNPALGVRGLRTSRRHPELLEDQLTAVAGAAGASGAEVWVMAPMVSTKAEAEAFAEQVRRRAGWPRAG